jgi:hypothetical protein
VRRVGTDPSDGSFEFRGLDPTERYLLVAFGRGYWFEDSVGPIKPGTSDVVCTVQTMFGAVVRIGGKGSALHQTGRLLGVGPNWDATPVGAESLNALPVERRWLLHVYGEAAMNDVSLDRAGNWRTSLVLFKRVDASTSPVEGVDFYVEIPGCEPVQATLELPWLGGGLGEIRLDARVLDACVGSLNVGRALGEAPGWNARADLILKSVESGRTFRSAIDLYDPGDMTLHHVSCGTYEVRLSGTDTMFMWPRPGSPIKLVTITSGDVASAGFGTDLSVGGVEVELVDEAGGAYRDSARLDFVYERQGVWYSRNKIGIPRAPYRCGLLPATDWAVRVELEDPDFVPLEDLTRFTVLAGRTTSVVVPIARR